MVFRLTKGSLYPIRGAVHGEEADCPARVCPLGHLDAVVAVELLVVRDDGLGAHEELCKHLRAGTACTTVNR